jgi:transcriptional regulator with XRE-family HTH domain
MYMKQPELGKKIAELRKAKGLTQEELVDRCNLSVRTLQRIESGEVTPRSHTVRVIFAALDYDANASGHVSDGKFIKVIDMFNLRENTMKKLTILTAFVTAIVLLLLLVPTKSRAQSNEEFRQFIEAKSVDFKHWFNTGQVDSLVNLYREDACLLTIGCGKEAIYGFYATITGAYKFQQLKVLSVSVSDTIAVEKGRWTVLLNEGVQVSGEYLTEWRLTGEDWLIVNDISDNY